MRPNLLNPLFGALTTLSGVGPKLERLYRRLLGRGEEEARIIDLLFHLPTGVIDRRARPKLRDVVPGTVATVAVTIDRHRPSPPHRPRAPYQIYASDETGDLILTFFNARRDFLEKLLPVGELRYVSGTTGTYDGVLQMVHPDRVVDEAGLAKLPLVEPVYPLTEGLGLNQVRKAVDAALPKLPEMPEWQEPTWLARERYPTFSAALTALHRPSSPADILPESRAWMRLAYDELLAGQLALALVRAHLRRPAGRATPGTGALRKTLVDALPYSLTTSQSRAIADIADDLAKPERMLRLLQGDVGSGKTVVALLSAATIIEGGRQAALMAPTEILARQHFGTIAPLAAAAGIEVAILTGRERGRERTEILDRLRLGGIHILVGTHALFQDDVAFRDLGLAVVDEQHRFGVHQRLALAKKGEAVDMLVMTATPIPRTLVLTYFGDMDVSQLREKPAGRQPIEDVRPLAATLAAGQDRNLDAGSRGEWRDGAKMLPRQDFGRRHQRRLPPAFDDGCGREQRHHGLARADIALQQPQHPLGLGQIGGDVGDRARLRCRERVGQRIDEFLAQRAGPGRGAAGGAPQMRAHQRQRELPGKQFVIGKPHPGAAFRQNIGGRRRPVQCLQRCGKARIALAR